MCSECVHSVFIVCSVCSECVQSMFNIEVISSPGASSESIFWHFFTGLQKWPTRAEVQRHWTLVKQTPNRRKKLLGSKNP